MDIPYQNMEIEQIYTQLLSDPHTAIAVCSAEEGEGVTSLAFALAQRNLLAGHSTLLVDLNLYRPAIKSLLSIHAIDLPPTSANSPKDSSNNSQHDSQHDNQHNGQHDNQHNRQSSTLSTVNLLSEPQLVCSGESTTVLTGVIAPVRREHIMKLRQPGALEQCISEWLTQYDTVIIDTSPINRVNSHNIPPERVAAACDGAILMVMAGRTTEAVINSALDKLNNANAQLLGCVFNDRDNPRLKDELLREASRMDPLFSWLSRPLKKIINQSRLLTLEV